MMLVQASVTRTTSRGSFTKEQEAVSKDTTVLISAIVRVLGGDELTNYGTSNPVQQLKIKNASKRLLVLHRGGMLRHYSLLDTQCKAPSTFFLNRNVVVRPAELGFSKKMGIVVTGYRINLGFIVSRSKVSNWIQYLNSAKEQASQAFQSSKLLLSVASRTTDEAMVEMEEDLVFTPTKVKAIYGKPLGMQTPPSAGKHLVSVDYEWTKLVAESSGSVWCHTESLAKVDCPPRREARGEWIKFWNMDTGTTEYYHTGTKQYRMSQPADYVTRWYFTYPSQLPCFQQKSSEPSGLLSPFSPPRSKSKAHTRHVISRTTQEGGLGRKEEDAEEAKSVSSAQDDAAQQGESPINNWQWLYIRCWDEFEQEYYIHAPTGESSWSIESPENCNVIDYASDEYWQIFGYEEQ